MGAANGCDFDSIIDVQTNGFLTVILADDKIKSCKPSEKCLAAFLAAAEPYTYLHCRGSTGKGTGGDDLLGKTTFPEMDYQLGPPHGKAVEGPTNTWVRKVRL
jgi:hypothetical protein